MGVVAGCVSQLSCVLLEFGCEEKCKSVLS